MIRDRARGFDKLERLCRRIAVLQILKDRTSEWVLAVFGNVGEEPAIPLDDETGESAFDVRFGFPAQLVAVQAHV